MQISTVTKPLSQQSGAILKKADSKRAQILYSNNDNKLTGELQNIAKQRQAEIEAKIKSIKSMEDALRITGFFDRNYLPYEKMFIPRAKNPAEQIAIYQKSLIK